MKKSAKFYEKSERRDPSLEDRRVAQRVQIAIYDHGCDVVLGVRAVVCCVHIPSGLGRASVCRVQGDHDGAIRYRAGDSDTNAHLLQY